MDIHENDYLFRGNLLLEEKNESNDMPRIGSAIAGNGEKGSD